MTSPNQPDVYDTNTKQILVTRDPVFCHPAIRNGVIVGRQPHTYFPLAIVMTIVNPLLGPVALLFAREYSVFVPIHAHRGGTCCQILHFNSYKCRGTGWGVKEAGWKHE